MLVSLFRTVILYLFIILSMRLMGKRQIGEMQPGELVITILISEIAAIPIQDINSPVVNAVISIGALIILEILLSAMTMKSRILRRAVNGKAAVIVKDGVIDQKQMRNMRLTVDDLMEELRLKDVFFLEDVAYAIVENNGKLSVLLRPECLPATAEQMNIAPPDTGLPVQVISDGVFEKKQVDSFAVDSAVIKKALKKKKLDITDVFLMTVDRQGNCVIIKKEA